MDELRTCMIRALLGMFIGGTVCLIYGREILEVIYRPLLTVQYANGLQPSLQVLSPTAGFTAYLKIGFFAGLIVAMPWLLFQMWKFVATGLYAREQRFVKLLIPASTGLFVLGVLFLYFIVLPMVLNFFIVFNKAFDMPNLTPIGFQSWLLPEEECPTPSEALARTQIPVVREDPVDPAPGEVWVNVVARRLMVKTETGILSGALEPGKSSPAMHSQFALDFYISFVLMLALAFGLAFETPIVVFFLAWSGIVTTAAMARGRRYVLFGTVIVAAILTPPDVISQVLLAVPMYALFELGLWVGRLVERKPAAAEVS
ncbi:MAG: twin-arginine translocase subunit TatC [Planctomycetes bacterium]|nr:twin-arginine translocase subunit TatC [Planctomycetota bacterium]